MADIELQDDTVVEEFFQSFQRGCYRLTGLGHPGLPPSAALLVGLLHHGGEPRSPKATFAACTPARATDCCGVPLVRRTSRRRAISIRTSSVRRSSGIDGSVARHRRPSMMK